MPLLRALYKRLKGEDMTKTEYIRKMYSFLAPMCTKYGYHNVAAGMIAQSIQEGWNSKLATEYHNYWGMKAGKSYKLPTVDMDNKKKTDPATYRAFTSMANGCEGYFIFLAYPRYAALKNCTNDIDYLDKIGPCGWNSNKGYGNRCKSHLKEVYAALDQAPQASAQSPQTSSEWQIGKTYSTHQDLYIRNAPNGEKMDWDDVSEDARKHGLKDDFGKAILNCGTRVTVKDIKETPTAVWLKIPSGWICGKNSKIKYVY